MANYAKIKIKRGTRANISKSTEHLEEGQLLYNLTDNYVTIGDNQNKSVKANPIVVRELKGFHSDDSGNIATTSSEPYGIKPITNGTNKHLEIYDKQEIKTKVDDTEVVSVTKTDTVVNNAITTNGQVNINNSVSLASGKIINATNGKVKVGTPVQDEDAVPYSKINYGNVVSYESFWVSMRVWNNNNRGDELCLFDDRETMFEINVPVLRDGPNTSDIKKVLSFGLSKRINATYKRANREWVGFYLAKKINGQYVPINIDAYPSLISIQQKDTLDTYYADAQTGSDKSKTSSKTGLTYRLYHLYNIDTFQAGKWLAMQFNA